MPAPSGAAQLTVPWTCAPVSARVIERVANRSVLKTKTSPFSSMTVDRSVSAMLIGLAKSATPSWTPKDGLNCGTGGLSRPAWDYGG